MLLVRGNHDILSARDYETLGIQTYAHCFSEGIFDFIHDPNDLSESNQVRHRICGHLHPGIRLSGLGKQSLRLSCFHSTPEMTILPAFSKFTGLALIEPKKGDKVYAILPANPRKGEFGTVIQIQ
jgi:metallophosphoesterase superfamily enzyme